MSGQVPSSPAQPGCTRLPTQLECNFLVAILKNSDGVTNIDWDSVASEAGYNNGGTARTRFGQVKKALGWTVRSTAKTSPSKSPTKVEKKPAKPRVRKTKAMTKKQEEAYKEASARAADDDSTGYEQDDANDVKEEHGNGYKQEHDIIKTEDVDEDGETPAEEDLGEQQMFHSILTVFVMALGLSIHLIANSAHFIPALRIRIHIAPKGWAGNPQASKQYRTVGTDESQAFLSS
ncbi:hypothetical protein V491_05003 [Pseudogymnoascus sp. VKM F-3775]|nr:hypothetical protein V491_05003 [Pseudogymnoascus sp. VKM F-3775]